MTDGTPELRRQDEHTEADVAGDVIATGGMSRKFLMLQLALWAMQFVVWGGQALTAREPFQIAMAVLAGAALLTFGWMAAAGTSIDLIVRNESLELRRRFRPLTVARADVVAIRGDVIGRPSWSSCVIIETRGGDVRLPALNPSPTVLVPRLQRWVEEGERPDA